MCIVVDPPIFVPIFKAGDPEHALYAPVLQWVNAGGGKFVLGGSKYREELQKIGSVLKPLLELEKRNKLVRVPDEKVDAEQEEAKRIQPKNDFDDPHLVALIRATQCRLICVRDPRSHRYLRASALYGGTKGRPRLYTRPQNRKLLCDKNIASCCK